MAQPFKWSLDRRKYWVTTSFRDVADPVLAPYVTLEAEGVVSDMLVATPIKVGNTTIVVQLEQGWKPQTSAKVEIEDFGPIEHLFPQRSAATPSHQPTRPPQSGHEVLQERDSL